MLIESFKQAIPSAIKGAFCSAMNRSPIDLPLSLKLKNGLPLSIKQKRVMIRHLMNEFQAPNRGKRILFWRGPSRGSIHVELMIALAMKLRGFDVQFIICDSALSGCMQRGIDKEPLECWEAQCPGCIQSGVDVLEGGDMSYVGISEMVLSKQREELKEICKNIPDNELDSYEYQNVPVGMFAGASTQRYLKGNSFKGHEQILREYLYSALVCTEAASTCLSQLKPDYLFMQQHDFYVEWGPAVRIALDNGIRVTFWGGGMYEDGGIALRPTKNIKFRSLHDMTDESWQQQTAVTLTERENEALDAFLNDYYHKRRAGTALQSHESHSREELIERLNITDKKPIWCLLTHVSWGEASNFEPTIYGDTISWILDTIRITNEIKDVTWLLKIHPAELLATVRGVENIIRDTFPDIDWDKRIIPAKSDISLQDIFPILSGGVTISGTPGIELALEGIPVILAGQAHYGEKGFTYDAHTKEQYAELLHSASHIKQLSEDQRKLARQYTYSLFFQRRIPLNMACGEYRFAPLDFRKLDLLLPGHDPAMDMICERIIDGGEFIL